MFVVKPDTTLEQMLMAASRKIVSEKGLDLIELVPKNLKDELGDAVSSKPTRKSIAPKAIARFKRGETVMKKKDKDDEEENIEYERGAVINGGQIVLDLLAEGKALAIVKNDVVLRLEQSKTNLAADTVKTQVRCCL
jgi:hypothetical protein